MLHQEFLDSLNQDTCPSGLEPCLRALWYDAKGEWDKAHEIVQQGKDAMDARIHAYLHRKEGDDWNARYWHRIAGSVFPEKMSTKEEWNSLLRDIVG